MAVGTPVFLAEGRDDVAETEEPHVDVNPLLQTVTLGLGFLLPFASSQIHEMELGDGEGLPVGV